MPWVFAALALVLIVAFALVLAGRLPSVPQPTRDRYVARLPEHPSAADVDGLRLPVALRGYRMDEVDTALATLRDRIAELEAGTLPPAQVPPGSAMAPVAPSPPGAPLQDDASPFAPPPPGGADV